MSKLKNRVEKLEVERGGGLGPVRVMITDPDDGTCRVSMPGVEDQTYASDAEAWEKCPVLNDKTNPGPIIHVVFVEGRDGRPVTRNPDGTFSVGDEIFASRVEMEAAYPSGGTLRVTPPAAV